MLTLQFQSWMVPTLVLSIAAVLVYVCGRRQNNDFSELNALGIILIIACAIAFVCAWMLRGCVS